MWQTILDWIFAAVKFFADICGDWGMSIIIITIIFRLIISPLTVKQNRSSHLMQKLQPEINEVQQLYANDQQKLSEEMQRIYKEANYNPLSGCLPMLIQMPIFIALFQVLKNMSDRVDAGTVLQFYGLIPDLTATPLEALDVSILYSIPYFILVAIFGASIIVPSLLQKNTEKQTLVMMIIMAVFMVYIGCNSPAGVVLFWDVSSIIALILQQVMKVFYNKRDEKKEEAVVKPVNVNVVRKKKKARPTKSR